MEANNNVPAGKRSAKETFMLLADIFFVLILCFVILFSTLVVTNSISMNDYTVNGYILSIPLLLATAAVIGGYLYFLLSVSLRGYREMEEAYKCAKAKEKEADHGSIS